MVSGLNVFEAGENSPCLPYIFGACAEGWEMGYTTGGRHLPDITTKTAKERNGGPIKELMLPSLPTNGRMCFAPSPLEASVNREGMSMQEERTADKVVEEVANEGGSLSSKAFEAAVLAARAQTMGTSIEEARGELRSLRKVGMGSVGKIVGKIWGSGHVARGKDRDFGKNQREIMRGIVRTFFLNYFLVLI